MFHSNTSFAIKPAAACARGEGERERGGREGVKEGGRWWERVSRV